MALADLSDWLDHHTAPNIIWYAKRLSGNDTLANGSHQAGPYVPKSVLFAVLPDLEATKEKNAEAWLTLTIDSHLDSRDVRAIWYNNKFRGGTRDEARMTNFGGKESALLDPESTGAIALFAFELGQTGNAEACRVWVTRDSLEEDIIEARTGTIDPGTWVTMSAGHHPQIDLFSKQPSSTASCWLKPEQIPPHWLTSFPPGAEIVEKVIEFRPSHGLTPDARILRRRDCEFEMFRSLEEAVELPRISEGFDNIESFLSIAQTILQRRKARSGRSLELHARHVLLEEGFVEDQDFAHDVESEANRRPDFLFPNQAAYQNASFPSDKLRMMAAKTTCRDRWRQILNEAERIPVKHLLTLQEGVSENQFKEMTESGVVLVVPEGLRSKFPASVQPELLSFESFIGDLRLL